MTIKAELIVSLGELFRRAVAQDNMVLAGQASDLQYDIVGTVPWELQAALIKLVVRMMQ